MTRTKSSQHCVRQYTFKNSINCSGTGLHSGAQVTMALHPAEPDTGVIFRRTDGANSGATIAATWQNVVKSAMCTTIANGNDVGVGTIEHLMAALSGCGVDNVTVEIDGPEVAIMDGSAEPFVFLIECAGVVEQDAPRRAIEVLKPVSVGDHDRVASLAPSKQFTVSCEIEFDSPVIACQACTVTLENGTFKSQISRARTFGFEHEVVQMRAAGLARGGSLENAVVIGGDRILNADGLRYDDEFARHKVLDCIGDLYLAGGPILGHFHGYRSGHAMNHRLLRALMGEESAWRYTTLESAARGSEHLNWSTDGLAATA